MAIELVVFDMAGTTVSDAGGVGASFSAALAAAGVAADPEHVKAVMGLPKPEAVRILVEAGGTAAASVDVAAVHRDFVSRMLRYYREDPAVREVPGATAVFRELRSAGVLVALNTGFSRGIADAILQRLGWGQNLVNATVTSDEVPRGRPHPDMIHHVMKQLGVADASRVAKVGDTTVDLDEGTSAGCGLVLGVLTGSATRAQLLARPHTHILESIVEIPALLRR